MIQPFYVSTSAGRAGGAVLVSGAVELTNCTLTGNQAGIGPAVSNAVTVTLSSTKLASNTLTCNDEGLFLDWKNVSAYGTWLEHTTTASCCRHHDAVLRQQPVLLEGERETPIILEQHSR